MIVAGGGEVFTSTSNSLPTPCRKMMAVARPTPSSELERISRKMYRSRIRMRWLTTGSRRAHLRRGYNGQLGQLLFDRMHLHVVHQHGWRNHTTLRHITCGANGGEGRRTVQEFEDVGVVSSGQDVLQRARVQAAETQAAHQFFPAVGIYPVDQHRGAHRMAAARLRGVAQ